MDLEELLAEAQAAIDAGAEPEEVYAHARALGQQMNFGGDLAFIVKSRNEAAMFQREADVINRVEDRGSVVNAIGMAAQGVSLGLLPDFLNLIGQEEAGEKFRGFVEETREVQPLAAGLAELSGGLAVPGIGAAKGTALTSRGLSSLGARVGGRVGGLLASPATTAAAVGGGAAAGASGLFGFAESVGEPAAERLSAAAEGATDPLMIGAGMLFGPIAGFTGSRMRRVFGGRGGKVRRVAEGLEESTGLSRDINSMRNRADLNVESAAAGLDALERNTPEIISEELEIFLDNIRQRPDVVGNLNRASREVATGQRFATVKDMRKLQANLRADQRFGDALELNDILDDAVPGYRDVNREFARAKDVREAIEIGQNGGGVTFRGDRVQLDTGANFEKALEVIAPEAHGALKTGVLHRELQNILGRRTGANLSVLRKLATDSEVDMRLRNMFTSSQAAEEFIQLLDKEASAEQLRRVLIAGGVLVAVGAGARAGLGSAGQRFFVGGN